MSDQLKSIAAAALRAVPDGPLGTALFDAVAEKSITEAFEAAAIRRGQDGRLYVYLRQRAADDTAYPGQFHIPGSVKRPGEKWADVMARLSGGEFGSKLVNRRKIGEIPTVEARGSFVSFLFLVDLEGETDPAKWYPEDVLPGPLVDWHENASIPMAIAAFKLEELKARFCDE